MGFSGEKKRCSYSVPDCSFIGIGPKATTTAPRCEILNIVKIITLCRYDDFTDTFYVREYINSSPWQPFFGYDFETGLLINGNIFS